MSEFTETGGDVEYEDGSVPGSLAQQVKRVACATKGCGHLHLVIFNKAGDPFRTIHLSPAAAHGMFEATGEFIMELTGATSVSLCATEADAIGDTAGNA